MNRKYWIVPFLGIWLIGMTGCSANNHAGVNNQSNNPRPVGYYSNENHPNQTYSIVSDNDGPIIEMMDHSLGAEGKILKNQKAQTLQTRDENGNPPNPTVPRADSDKNFFQHDNRFSTSDANYHDHLSEKNFGFTKNSKALEKITSKIRNKTASVNNVKEVRSVTYGSSVLISVILIDQSNAGKTKKDIQNAVKPYVKGKKVTVITDESTFSRKRTEQKQ